MNPPQKWTRDEDQILRDNYFDTARDDLLAMLPRRSWDSIHSHASRLKLRRKHVRADHQATSRKIDKAVVDAVIQFFYETGFGPQRADISRATGIVHSTVARSVDRLIRRGLLVRGAGRFSAIALAPPLRKKLLEQERALRDRVKAVA